MNGAGGELLGGYPRYFLTSKQMHTALLTSDCFSAKALIKLATQLSTDTSMPLRVIRKMMMEFGWPELRAVPIRNEFWNEAMRAELLGKDVPSDIVANWRSIWYEKACKYAVSPVERMLWYDSHTYLAGCLLPKMDIASMRYGLETRSPLLDHEVIEYCASLPVGFKVSSGVGKFLLKKLAERYFPCSFVHRPKMGFGIPLSDWLRGLLRSMLEDTLRNCQIMAPLEARVIDKTLDEFLYLGIDHSNRLWALLMYGVWHKNSGLGGIG